MNQCLLRYYKAGIISEQDALANAGQYTELRQMIRMAYNKGEVAIPQSAQQAMQQAQNPQQQQPPQPPRLPGLPPTPGR